MTYNSSDVKLDAVRGKLILMIGPLGNRTVIVDTLREKSSFQPLGVALKQSTLGGEKAMALGDLHSRYL